MLVSVLKRDRQLIQNAIDAIIELEGLVYPNGLSAELRAGLQDLRAREGKLNEQIDGPIH